MQLIKWLVVYFGDYSSHENVDKRITKTQFAEHFLAILRSQILKFYLRKEIMQTFLRIEDILIVNHIINLREFGQLAIKVFP